MSVQIATWGPKVGECNMCGDIGRLTEDHTPPKGCIRVGQVEIRHIVDRLSAEARPTKGRFSQNGVKYRTLCGRCNNSLLGTKYDPAFIDFVNAAGTFLKSSLALPKMMSVRGRPQKIMRAVLGHLSAQGVNRYLKGPETEAIRDYFLDESLPLPDALKIYYWAFPYMGQVLVRDCALMDLRVGKPVVIWLMKFFPLAFLVTWKEPADYNFDLPCLSTWRSYGIDDEVELSIPLDKIVHEYWPEAPTDTSIVTYGRDAVIARGLPKRK